MDTDAAPQKSPTSLVGVVLTLFGLVGGLADYWLVVASRGHCNAGAEPDNLASLLLFHLPTRLVLGGALGGGSFLVVRLGLLLIPAVRRSPQGATLRTVIAASTAFAAVVAMVWIDFAVVGTLDGYPAASSVCPPSNIPPWWPSWLPA